MIINYGYFYNFGKGKIWKESIKIRRIVLEICLSIQLTQRDLTWFDQLIPIKKINYFINIINPTTIYRYMRNYIYSLKKLWLRWKELYFNNESPSIYFWKK